MRLGARAIQDLLPGKAFDHKPMIGPILVPDQVRRQRNATTVQPRARVQHERLDRPGLLVEHHIGELAELAIGCVDHSAIRVSCEEQHGLPTFLGNLRVFATPNSCYASAVQPPIPLPVSASSAKAGRCRRGPSCYNVHDFEVYVMLTVQYDLRRPNRVLAIRCLMIGGALLLAARPIAAVEPAGPAAAAASAGDPARPGHRRLENAGEDRPKDRGCGRAERGVRLGRKRGGRQQRRVCAHGSPCRPPARRDLFVVFPDGRRARAVTLGNDYGVDPSCVKVADEGPWPHAEWGRSDNLSPGQWCLTLGYPVNFEHGKMPAVRIGRVLHYGKKEIITDGTIMGGDSGAPLFDLDGKIIGIGTKCIDLLVYNIHVPIDRYRDDWEKLVQGKDFDSLAPKQALLGVIPAEGSDEARRGPRHSRQRGRKRRDSGRATWS